MNPALKALLITAVLIAAAVAGYSLLGDPAGLVNRYTPHSPTLPEQWMQAYGYLPDHQVAFTFDRGYGRPLFMGEVNGRKVELFFDSGSAFGLTVPIGWVQEEAWPVIGELRHVVGGRETGTFPTFAVSSFSVAGIALPLAEGASSDTREAHFGWSALEGHRITLDYAHGQAAISPTPLPDEVTATRNRYVTRYISPGGREGAVLIPVRLGEQEYLALVDTGASVSAIDRELADVMGLAPNLIGRVRLDGLMIGPFRLDIASAARRPVDTLFREGPRPHFVLGADVLSRFLVTFDYVGGHFVMEW